MIVLAIESTCDETGAAVGRLVPPSPTATARQGAVEILSDVKATSAEIFTKYGGIVPEIAAREQVAAIVPVIEMALRQLAVGSWQSAVERIDAIAVSQGPGLIGSLLIGVETAKTLALAWKKPLIAVNHMAAHVFANWITPTASQLGGRVRPSTGSDTVTQQHSDTPELPAVALIVSGGHTDLMLLNSLTDWKWIGGVRDDAAGEAFDKAARIMGLPYPGGPEIARAAQMADGRWQMADWMKLPRPMIHEDNLEMSFSGLKTALIQVLSHACRQAGKKDKGLSEGETCLLAREFNQAVVDVLVKKTMMAVERHQPKSVLLAGGVAANALLRESLAKDCKLAAVKLYVPELKYCTDNAAMIAACALLRPNYVNPLMLRPNSGLEIK